MSAKDQDKGLADIDEASDSVHMNDILAYTGSPVTPQEATALKV